MSKKRSSGLRINKYYMCRLIGRFILACYCFGIYLTNKKLLDISSFPEWKGMYVIAGIILVDFILRFIPFKYHPMGMRKHVKSTFIPSLQYKENGGLSKKDEKDLEQLKKEFTKGLLFYFGLTAIWFVLYFLHIFGVPELFMIMMAYYVGDMICVNLFCPFRMFFMKNRCCTVCRIYNWDALFLVFPLIVVPGVLTWGLNIVAIIYTFIWELSFRTHPERFLVRTNMAIRCENCPKTLCPQRREKYLRSIFFGK